MCLSPLLSIPTCMLTFSYFLRYFPILHLSDIISVLCFNTSAILLPSSVIITSIICEIIRSTVNTAPLCSSSSRNRRNSVHWVSPVLLNNSLFAGSMSARRTFAPPSSTTRWLQHSSICPPTAFRCPRIFARLPRSVICAFRIFFVGAFSQGRFVWREQPGGCGTLVGQTCRPWHRRDAAPLRHTCAA